VGQAAGKKCVRVFMANVFNHLADLQKRDPIRPRHAHAQAYVYQIISVVYLPAYDPVIFASWYLTVVAQQKSYVILKICEEAVGLSGKISGAM
jgi:DNA polymerase III alpha subunit (gram-positive type)